MEFFDPTIELGKDLGTKYELKQKEAVLSLIFL